MHLLLSDLIAEDELHDFQMFLYELRNNTNKYLLSNDILLGFEEFCLKNDKKYLLKNTATVHKFLNQIPELILYEKFAYIVHRYRMANYKFYKISIFHKEYVEEITVGEFLNFLDKFASPNQDDTEDKLRLDFLPFYDYGPRIRDVKSIGRGIEFLNKYMSSNLFQNPEKWNVCLFEFLKIHSLGNQQLLIEPSAFKDYNGLTDKLQEITDYLESKDPETSHTVLATELKRHGFEAGWGNTAARIGETMKLLLELFHSPDSQNLGNFISRIPMISKIAIISPHGWFGQEKVLGKPDTGGQVVYILDQVRALEKALIERLTQYGLATIPHIIVLTRLIPENEGTTSNQFLEKIHRTENSWILRVPFRDHEGIVVPNWIPRFEVWPYLNRFAFEAEKELVRRFEGKPDLIIGNYSDGNLVATLLSEIFEVIQCNISHALEKAKYLFSDLYWSNFEDDYHFSLQFVADLISMNMADFVITSTFQEIAGTQYTAGQYESYQFFTMPTFMQVENGINLFHPKFNVIPPGVDEQIFFPYYENDRRLPNQTEKLKKLLFHKKNKSTYGHLEDKKKIPIFTMARLDRVKNITGLVESFGKSPELQEKCNLIVIAGKVDASLASDAEETAEIQRMYQLIDNHNLEGKIRWLGIHLPKGDTGEVYRIIADHQGVFVQPARFEGFGLTVLEAMVSGLPVFATQFGGPSEIVNDKKNGFLINPTVPELISNALLEFVNKVQEDPSYWQSISERAIQRVGELYTWKLYSNRLLDLTALYGFWRYSVSNIGKLELRHYCHLLLHLLFQPRAKELEIK